MPLKYKLKNFAYLILNIMFGFLPVKKASILMYHSVGNNGILFTVTEKGEEIKPKTGAITFDDAYQDNYSIAFPILKRHSFPATIFAPTAYIGKEMMNSEGKAIPVMNWQEAQEMEESGLVDFASHSHTHPMMDRITFEEFINEVKTSENLLNQNLKRPVKIFSFPKGKFKPENADYFKKQDYLGAVTVKEGLVGPNDDIFTLKRNFVFSMGGFSQFKGKLGRSVEIMNWLKKR